MALADTQKLTVELGLVDKLSPAINRIDRRLGAFSGAVNRNVGRVIDTVVSKAARGLTDAFSSGVQALKEDAVVAAQTGAVIKSTGGKAGVTAQQVADLADKLSVLDGVSDDVVQSSENMLLTFTKIGKNVLPTATQTVLDMSAALGQDTKNSAIQLGKALNDPVKGITALQRVGVTFSKTQRKHIDNLIKQGKLEQAQRVILKELKKEFGGVAKAQADADPSRRLAISTEKFQKSLAKGLLPVVEKVQKRLSEWLVKPETLATVSKIGDTIGALFTDQNLDAIANGVETAAKAVTMAIGAFNSLPPEIKALAIGALAVNKVTGGAVGGIAKGLAGALGAGLKQIFATNVEVIGGSVTGGGAASGAAGAAGSAGKVGKIANAVKVLGAVTIAAGSIAELAQTFISVNDQSSQIAQGLKQSLDQGIAVKTPQQLQEALDGVRQGINDISSNPLNVLVSGDALNTLHSMEGDLQSKLAQINRTTGAGDERVASRISSMNAAVKTHASRIAADVRHSGSTTSSKLGSANAKLDAIRHKRTSFSTHVNVAVSTSVRTTQGALTSTARYRSGTNTQGR